MKTLIIILLGISSLSSYSQNYISVTYTPIVNSIGMQVNKCFESSINITAGIEKNMFKPKDENDIKFTKFYAGIGKKLSESFIVNIALGYYSFNEIGIDLGIIFVLDDHIHIIADVDITSWIGLTKGIYAPKIGLGINL